jgi:transposase InsO family protein
MIRYVDAYRDQFGVELICRVLGNTAGGFMTSRGYRAAKTREPSSRAIRDQVLGDEMERLHAENYGVYGVRKMHRLMQRQGWLVGRDQVARVMKTRGITGVRRGKTTFTTRSKTTDTYPADKVNRQFQADRPNQLWVADITYVATWQGFAYVAFVTDVFSRKIVGWSVSSTLKTDMLPLQALNMAAWMVSDDLTGLVHHSDRGSNYVSLAYTDRIVELGGTPSVGSKGDSYDNAMAESQFALFETELIKKRRPWRSVEQVELATLEWVWWFNNQRLHSELDYRTPAEVEAEYYAGKDPVLATAIHGNT